MPEAKSNESKDESSSGQSEIKEYDKIQESSTTCNTDSQKQSDDYTTIMLRNIPNKYTREMLVKELRRHGFTGKYDFLYLPTDFANDANPGYCFVDFRTDEVRKLFEDKFHGKSVQDVLPAFKSHKICQVTKAKYQGLEENVNRLKESSELMKRLAVRPHCTPLMFDEHGNQMHFETPNLTDAELEDFKHQGVVREGPPGIRSKQSSKGSDGKSKNAEKGKGKGKSKDKGRSMQNMSDKEFQTMAALIGNTRALQAKTEMQEAYLHAYHSWMAAAIESYWWNGAGSWSESNGYWGSDWNTWSKSAWET